MRAAFLMIPEPARPHFRGDFRALPGRPEDIPATAVERAHCCGVSWRERGGKG